MKTENVTWTFFPC